MPYQICLFEDGVQAVPSNWIDGDSCKYPPFMNQIRINKALATMQEPESNWTTHIIERTFGPLIENYQDAVSKAKLAEKFSDIETDEESGKFKRKDRAAKKLFDYESSDDEPSKKIHKNKGECSTKEIPDLPAPPKEPVVQHKAASTKPPTSKASTSQATGDKETTPVGLVVGPSPRRTPRKTNRSRTSPKKDFKEEILRKLNILLFKVRMIEAKLDDLAVKGNTSLPDPEEIDIFPITTESQLIDFNQNFDQEILKKCVQQLRVLGGISVPEIVQRLLKRMVTNEMANKFSMLGRKKKSFKADNLYKVVTATVRVHRKEATEKELLDPIIARWLVQAKMRIGRSNKPSTERTADDEMDLLE